MSANKIFIYWAGGTIFWIFIWNTIIKFEFIVFFLVFIFLLLAIFCVFIKRFHNILIIIALWIFIWSSYSFYYNSKIQSNIEYFEKYYDNSTDIYWKIESIYKKNDYWYTYISKLDNTTENIYFLLNTQSNLEVWQKFYVNSKILEIKNFSSNFDYKKYLLSKKIYFKIIPTKINFLEKNKIFSITFLTQKIKKNILEKINYLYPKLEANLITGLIIWEKLNFSKEMLDNFAKAGLMHIITVSGFNISLIILFLATVLKIFPKYIRLCLIILLLVFYIQLVWMTISSIRAGIMWILWYFALLEWRQKDNLSIIILTCLLIWLYNPLILNYNISFHMSFLAVIWILYTKKFWDKIFYFLPKKFAIKDSFCVAISASTMIFPIMLLNFWYLSIFNPIISMLIWWILPICLFFWSISIWVSFINNTLWYIIWFIPYLLLKFINKIAFFVWWLKFSVIEYDFGQFWKFYQILYFMILIFILVLSNTRKNIILDNTELELVDT